MNRVIRARIAGFLAICLLMLSAPGAMTAVVNYLPDAQIRPGWNPTYTGGGVINDNAAGQEVWNSGVVGQKLTFFIKIVNVGMLADSFKVKRSGFFNDGYRVRYYDAEGNDVTGKVNVGSFKTPVLDGLSVGEYVMSATVKIRSLATPCSSVTRLLTVTATGDADFAMDAVRFTAGLAPLCPT